ncbi:MAG: patatin family protein [Bacillota bacterium]
MEKATLLLEGGAARGIFTTGALDYLMEKEFVVSDVIGISAGACNLLGYVAGQKGWLKDCLIHDDGEFCYFDLKNFMYNKSVMDMDLMFDKVPNEMVPFDYDSYFNSKINSYIGISNCASGQIEYCSGIKDRKKLLDICRASSSIPVVAPIVEIDGEGYLDGGISAPMPIKFAEEIGNEKIIVILTKNKGYRKAEKLNQLAGILNVALGGYPNLLKALDNEEMIYNADMDYLEQLEEEGKIFVIRPEEELCKLVEQDPAELTRSYNHGYENMKAQYDNLLKYMGK